MAMNSKNQKMDRLAGDLDIHLAAAGFNHAAGRRRNF